MNRVMAMPPMMRSVRLAFWACGFRKAVTPFETASTPGQRAAPGGEGAQDHDQADSGRRAGRERVGDMCRRPAAGDAAHDAHHHHDQHRGHEAVGREGEEEAGLPHAAQVHQGEKHEHQQADRHLVRLQRGHGRRQGQHARHDAHRHGEHVVNQQRRGGHEAGVRAQVLAGHDVGPAAVRVGVDGLPVGEDDDGQQGGDGHRDGDDQVGRRQRGGHQDGQRGLGGVGHGREGVRGEDRQGQHLRQQLLLQALDRDRAAEQGALERQPARWLQGEPGVGHASPSSEGTKR